MTFLAAYLTSVSLTVLSPPWPVVRPCRIISRHFAHSQTQDQILGFYTNPMGYEEQRVPFQHVSVIHYPLEVPILSEAQR